jgi:transposase
VTRLAPEWL